MIYSFKTRFELIRHLRALCELSGAMSHCSFPIRDFEFDLPTLLDDCLTLKHLAIKFSCRNSKIYICFRSTGFESSTIFHHFKSRITAFHTSVIACYTITFADGCYILEQFEL